MDEDPSPNATPPPVQLEYFSPQSPERRRGRGVVVCSLLLLASWAPYLCGIVSASTVAVSYVPEITRAHLNATILMFGASLLLSGICFAWFVRARHLAGAISAAFVFAMQTFVAVCLGIAR